MEHLFPASHNIQSNVAITQRVTEKQIDHIIIEGRHFASLTDVGSRSGANCNSDHYLVVGTYPARIADNQKEHVESANRWKVMKLADEAEKASSWQIRRPLSSEIVCLFKIRTHVLWQPFRFLFHQIKLFLFHSSFEHRYLNYDNG